MFSGNCGVLNAYYTFVPFLIQIDENEEIRVRLSVVSYIHTQVLYYLTYIFIIYIYIYIQLYIYI